jgi:hypothetical protein
MVVEDEGFVHKLIIANPTLADMGKYTCEVNGIVTEAFLEVEGTLPTCFAIKCRDKLNILRDVDLFLIEMTRRRKS